MVLNKDLIPTGGNTSKLTDEQAIKYAIEIKRIADTLSNEMIAIIAKMLNYQLMSNQLNSVLIENNNISDEQATRFKIKLLRETYALTHKQLIAVAKILNW